MAVSSKTASDPDRSGLLTSPRRRSPIRTCIGCRKRAAATELLRVVADGTHIVPDPRRRAPGRGAWLHRELGCLDLAERRRAFGRALRASGSLDPTAVREYVERFVTTTSGTPQE